jgi:hypothetical protein
MKEEQIGEILIYQSEEGSTKIEVRLQNENVWLSQQQMSELYQSSRTNVVEHIKHIYEEGELNENSTCRKFRQVQIEGTRSVEREIPFYNLDMIISLGYRIKSHIATKFRIWATECLKEYIVKGFTMDDERLLTDAFSVHPSNIFKTKFIYYFLKNEQEKIHLMKKGGGVPHVRASDFEFYFIPIPPLSEQERIVGILDKFDALVNDLSVGLPAEIAARRKQYEYYRGKLLDFKPLTTNH